MKYKKVLGIDIGGSGIKGAIVNTKTGKLLTERFRIPTPKLSTPENVVEVLRAMVKQFKWKGPVGVGFPSVVINGEILSASNIDKSWIGVNAQEYFSKVLKLPVIVINDADAAGIAEMNFGAGKGILGTVILITVGTGIGTSVFTKGELLANSELGQVFLENGLIGEAFAADSVREKQDLSWKDWGGRLNIFLKEVEKLFYPELIIVGGGVSKRSEKYKSAININTELVMAEQRNEAGIIGAALAAKKNRKLLKIVKQS